MLEKILSPLEVIHIVALKFHYRFYPLFRLGEHIRYKYILVPVIVDIPHIYSHGGKAEVPGPVFNLFGKGPVLIIYIEVIPFVKVIGYIKVGI